MTQSGPPPVTLVADPLSPEFRASPHEAYDRVRSLGPVVRCAGSRSWLVTGNGVARSVLTREDFARWRRDDPGDDPFESVCARWTDAVLPAPAGGVLRHDVVRALGEPRVQRVIAVQARLAEHLLDLALLRGGMDVVRDYATPLAVVAAADVLGLDLGECRTLATLLCAAPGETLEPVASAGAEPGDSQGELLGEALARHDRHMRTSAVVGHVPPDPLLSALVRAVAAGAVGPGDAVPFARFFLFALVDNLVGFLGNAVEALAGHPDALLAAPGVRTVDAVDELLRLEGPVQLVRLTALRDAVIGDRTVASGEDVLVGLAAANRDPARYDRPHELRWDRAPSNHLAFGWGAGRCIGARLARREATVALEALVRRVGGLRLVPGGGTRRIRPEVIQGWRRLEVEVASRRAR